MRKGIDLSGQVFGRWKVLYEASPKIYYTSANKKITKRYWHCKCICDNNIEKDVSHQSLTNGESTSCGCYHKEVNKEKAKKLFTKEFNEHVIDANVVKIFTTNDRYCIIDLEDLEKIKHFRWVCDNYGYWSVTKDKKKIKLHRLIMDCIEENREVDHINGNPSDNRKENLRIVSHQENTWNQKMRTNNKSGITGIWYDKREERTKHWVAEIKVNGKKIALGSFSTKEEAIQAREFAENQYFGDFSRKRDSIVFD